MINNFAFADPSFGEEPYSLLFLIHIIDLIIASSIKDILKLIENTHKYIQMDFHLIALVEASVMRTRAATREHNYTNRDILIAPILQFPYAYKTSYHCKHQIKDT